MIRFAQLSDLDEMLAIYNEAILTTTATFDIEIQTYEQRKAWFDKYGDKYPLIVYEEAGKVRGYSCLSKFREKDAYNSTVELSVYVGSEARGKGVGKALLGEIIQLAKDKGFHSVLGGITSGNEVSIGLHKQFGFEKVAHFNEVGFKFDAWQDVEFYQLLIN